MLPMPAIVRWSSSASPIGARRVVLAQPAQEALLVELAARGCPGRAARAGGRSACATRSAARAPGRRTGRPRRASVRSTSHARRGGAAPALAVAVGAPGAGHAQVRVDREVALEAQEEVLAVGVDGRDRAAGELLGPALAAQARAAACAISSGTRPSRTGRMRSRRVVDRVALGHRCSGYGPRGTRLASRGAPSSSGSSAPSTCSRGRRRRRRGGRAAARRARSCGRAAPRRSPRSSPGATSTTSRSCRVGGRSGLAGGAARAGRRRPTRSRRARPPDAPCARFDPPLWRMEAEAGVTTHDDRAPRARERAAASRPTRARRAVAARRHDRDERRRPARLQVRRDRATG